MTTIPARLWKLFHKMHPEPVADDAYDDWWDLQSRFRGMIACEAYLSAAEMCVPEGCFWSVLTGCEVQACCQRDGAELVWHEAPTPAEALIAALEAMENDDE